MLDRIHLLGAQGRPHLLIGLYGPLQLVVHEYVLGCLKGTVIELGCTVEKDHIVPNHSKFLGESEDENIYGSS